MDILLALIPWTILWGLQMKRQEKLAAGIAMSMGILYVALQASYSHRNFHSGPMF